MTEILANLAPDLTASKAWGQLAKAFTAARLETPVIDARILVCHVLGLDRLGLIKEPNRSLGAAAPALVEAARRRLDHEPVSRIVGERAFHGRSFIVTPDTLDPRPDSETLVEAALHFARQPGRTERPLRVLDLGTGTGCLLLTLLAELPDATGVGIDISPGALDVARRNADRLGLSPRASFAAGDWAAGLSEAFDLVVANPPYIPAGEIGSLAPEVVRFDPRLALDGGPDGLTAYRAILATAPRLSPTGGLLLEVGAGQARDVVALVQRAFPDPGLQLLVYRDLGGIERVVAASLARVA